MAEQANTTFSPHDKSDWIAKVEKELKGKAWTELNWALNQQITAPAFFHPSEKGSAQASLPGHGTSIQPWGIGSYVVVGADKKEANENLLEALAGGVEVPMLVVRQPLTVADLDVLLAGVQLPFIQLHWSAPFSGVDSLALFEVWLDWLDRQEADPTSIRFSFNLDPFLDVAAEDFSAVAQKIKTTQARYPQGRCIQVNGDHFYNGNEGIVDELAHIVAKGNAILQRFAEAGVDKQTVWDSMTCSYSIGTSYFVQIAKMRALKLLWGQLRAGNQLAGDNWPHLEVHFARAAHNDDINTNYIRSATQAMAAVIGGCDSLFVRPANQAAGQADSAHTVRIARNVQQLLRLESYLGRVNDPAAGSYYIENLTRQMAEQAYAAFQQLDAERAYG